MKETKFKIKDESQDRKYFSIIPNYIVNHSTLEERGFYLTLKRIAGEEGSVYYSAKKLGELCGIKKSRVYELIDQLLERGWVKVSGSIATGHRPRRTYAIVDLWKQNIDFYESKKKVHADGKSKIVHKDGQTLSTSVDTKEETVKENLNYNSETSPNSKSRQIEKANKKENSRCPLLLKEKYPTLVEKYPNGHAECIEFIDSIQDEYKNGRRFVNYAKQLGALHKILRAGYDFKEINNCIDKMEKNPFWREKGWDFTNVANVIEKGGG